MELYEDAYFSPFMMAESDFTRGRSNTSSVCTTLWSGPASGTRQLQYSLDVPGWFCERV